MIHALLYEGRKSLHRASLYRLMFFSLEVAEKEPDYQPYCVDQAEDLQEGVTRGGFLPFCMWERVDSMGDNDIDRAIRRVRDGDADAFSIIVRIFERPVRCWLAASASPGVDIDEVAQRSFVAAYLGLNKYRNGTDFGAWLFTIARFQLKTELTRLRRSKSRDARLNPEIFRQRALRVPDQPQENMENRLDHLRNCVEMLGNHLKQFVRWRYYDGVPLEEMAVRTGRSLPAVKKQLWKLRRALHACVRGKMAANGPEISGNP